MRNLINILIIFTLVSCSHKPKRFSELTDSDFKHVNSLVNGETISYKTAVTKNDPQKFLELDQNDIRFCASCRSFGDSLIRKHLPNNSIKDYTPETLDKLIDLYIQGKVNCSQNEIVNFIGVLMGDYLVTHLRMKWVIIEDEDGRDFGVTKDSIKLTNFPLNSVLKDIEHRSEGSCNRIYLMTLQTIKEIENK
jgi:hypothetical protein